jgi:hypothetical protein
VLAQLAPDMRPVFTERVERLLGAHPDDCDRAVRQALVGLWKPPEGLELQRAGRWNSNAPAFERVSKQAVWGELRRACGLNVDSRRVVRELSIWCPVRI